MADSRFFHKNNDITLKNLADKTGCIVDEKFQDNIVRDVAPLDVAGDAHVTFFDNIKYKDQFLNTNADACIVSEDMAQFAPDGVVCLLSKNPYKSYALTAQYFYPTNDKANIAENAHIDKTAKIGKNCIIEPGAIIGQNVELGDNCHIGANAVITHAIIGSHVKIYRGVCIGQDGFGFAPDPAGHVKVPQLGRVIIGNGVEIGANTTIDRGAGPDTVIGDGTWIDNLVQIGHNVRIGKGCVIVAQVGISGSTVLEDFAMIGGQAGIAGHLTIGKGAQVAAQSGVMRDIPAGEVHMGSPAMPIKQFMRQTATLKRLLKKGS